MIPFSNIPLFTLVLERHPYYSTLFQYKLHPEETTLSEMPWTDKVEEKTKELFKAYDTDGSGNIDWQEFERALKAESGIAYKAEFSKLDTDKDGKVSQEEFLTAFKKACSACEESDLLSFLDEKIKVISKGVAFEGKIEQSANSTDAERCEGV